MKTKNERFNFTKAAIQKIPLPEKGGDYFYDSKARGLAVRVSASGKRSFYYIRRTDDGPIRKSIGGFPETTIEKARKKAERWSSNPDDPELTKRPRLSNTVTGKTHLGTLWELWAKGAEVRKKSFQGDKYNYEKHLSHWKDRGIGKIRRVHVLGLYEDISAKSGKYMANRIIALLSSLFNFARIKYEYPGLNPCSLFFKMEGKGEKRRERRLLDSEVKPLFKAIREESETIQDILFCLLFTGARRGNVFSMRWDEINMDYAAWTIPETKSKSGKEYTVPLVPFVMDILKRRLETSESDYVFPSERRKNQPVTEIRKDWDKIREGAELNDFRLHDLRRSLASKMADQGVSALVIDAILGHKGAEIVNVYARVGEDPARKALERAVDEFLLLEKKKEGDANVEEVQKAG